jgi:hypothetical protein
MSFLAASSYQTTGQFAALCASSPMLVFLEGILLFQTPNGAEGECLTYYILIRVGDRNYIIINYKKCLSTVFFQINPAT